MLDRSGEFSSPFTATALQKEDVFNGNGHNGHSGMVNGRRTSEPV
uniref:Uncharacterized protein n=1 Tax=Romanomermis culicivorax TaxID=13658 RepID=A0A915JMY2_ROMCU